MIGNRGKSGTHWQIRDEEVERTEKNGNGNREGSETTISTALSFI